MSSEDIIEDFVNKKKLGLTVYNVIKFELNETIKVGL